MNFGDCFGGNDVKAYFHKDRDEIGKTGIYLLAVAIHNALQEMVYIISIILIQVQ